MPKVVIDVSGVPEGQGPTPYDGPVPPKGLYKAVWKRGWWTKTKAGDKSMLKMLFILDTDHKDKKVYNGYPVFHNVTFEPSTLWKMKELFTALGVSQKSGVDYDESNGDVKRIGRAQPNKTYVLIHGKAGSWQGEARLEINTLAPIPRKDDEEAFDDDGSAEYIADESEDATDFANAGGVTPSNSEAPVEDPWATTAAAENQDDTPPF